MWWILGAIVAAGAVVMSAALWCACAAAGRCDDAQDAIEAARRREAAKHAVDVAWWSLMADAALAAAREGDCNA